MRVTSMQGMFMFPAIRIMAVSIGSIVIAATVTTCAGKNGAGSQGENTMAGKTIEEVLKGYTPELMSLRGVVGTAQALCDGKPCIRVLVSEKTPELDQKIPEVLEGYPVMREETGEIRALPRNRH